MDLHPGPKNRRVAGGKLGELEPIQRALLENEDWYQDIVEHSLDLLCIHNLEGWLLAVNPAPARVLGYSVEEILQIPMRELIAPEFRSQFDAYLKQIAQAGEARGLLVVISRTGERRIWEYHNTLRTEGVASPIVRGTAHDITEQMRAERLLREVSEDLLSKVTENERTIRELKLFRTLVDQISDAIEVVDPETLRFLDANEKACADLGYSREELLSLGVFDIDPAATESSVVKIKEALRETGVLVIESLHRRKDGSTFPVEVSMRWVHLERDYVISIARDLSERTRAEEMLAASEERYRTVYDRSPVGICWVDSGTGRYLKVNRKYCEITGRTEQDLLSRDFQSVTHPDDLAKNCGKLHQLMKGEVQHFEMKKRYIRPDGSLRWAEVEIVSMASEGEMPTWHLAIVQDITERRRAEEGLREYERMVEGLEEMIVVMDRDYRFVIANRAYVNYRAMKKEEIIGHRVDEILDPGVFETVVKKKMDECFQGKIVQYEIKYVYPNLGERDLYVSYFPIEGTTGVDRIAGVLRDITERKQVGEALRRSEEDYRMFISQSSEGIFREDMDAPVPVDLPEDELVRHIFYDSWMAECNDAMARMYGMMSGKEFVGKRLTELLPPDDPCNIELTREYIRSGFRVLDRESHEVDIHGNPKVFLNSMIGTVENGMLVRTWGIQRDITEKVRLEESRQKAEEALRESEQRFRIALAGSPIAVFNQDRDLRYTWVYNPQEGWSEADYLAKTDEDIFEPDIAARMTALKRPVLETGKGTRQGFSLTARGKTYYCDLTVEPLRDAAGSVIGVNCASVDVTHLRGITEELRLAKEKLAEEKLYLEQAISSELGFGEIIGRSGALKDVMEKVAKVAPSDATVLLLGETGTGKELVARAIHRLSNRQGNSFIKLNCAAIPSGLLESELFGHEKGAFTGAIAKKVGRLELADQGTLFLDEIGEIPLDLQPKLLRVLQDQEFERLGGTQTLKVNFRLVAASNRDLPQSVKQREFRSDLYYRLHVFPIRLPALRDRREDIRLLVEHFVRKYALRMNKSITSIPAKTMEALVRWDWPGNIRELENLVERSVILTPGSVLQAPLGELHGVAEEVHGVTLRDKERERILRVLRECRGQIGGPNGAAARLGLKRTTLQSKINQLGIKYHE